MEDGEGQNPDANWNEWRKNQGRNTMAANGSVGCDPPDKLLLSALKYWEVERDLIEERLATMRSATAAS